MIVREAGGWTVFEPPQLVHYDIESLVAAITDENRHEPVDMGQPIGDEIW